MLQIFCFSVNQINVPGTTFRCFSFKCHGYADVFDLIIRKIFFHILSISISFLLLPYWLCVVRLSLMLVFSLLVFLQWLSWPLVFWGSLFWQRTVSWLQLFY